MYCRGVLWFPWRGDEVGYVLPWHRKPGSRYRWVSLLCEGGFPTTTAMRCFWIEYEVAERRAMRRDRLAAVDSHQF